MPRRVREASRALRLVVRHRVTACVSLFIWCLACFLEPPPLVASGQQEPIPPRAPQATFRVSEDLATIDAIVTDKHGDHALNLGPEDFEVRQGGKTLPVRQVVYIDATTSAPAPAASTPAPAAAGTATPAPTVSSSEAPSAPQPEARTLALVIDDLGLSFESTYAVRRAVGKFVDTQVQPRDLVAIARTGGGVGALQLLTTDKRVLHAAIDNIRWTATSRFGIGPFTPVSKMAQAGPNGDGAQNPSLIRSARSAEETSGHSSSDIRNTVLAAAWLNALEFVVQGLQPVPGRKAVVVFSEGFDMFNDRLTGEQVWHSFIRLMNRANRAGVVVYTVDPRGLTAGGITAEDDPQPKDEPEAGGRSIGDTNGTKQRQIILDTLKVRHDFLRNSQDALYYMAAQTGGLAIQNTNDLSAGLGRVLNDLRGYYLIGYESKAGALADWEHAPVSIRVKKPGLTIRSRQGPFGPATRFDDDTPAIADPLVAAALSPFTSGAVPLRLNALFARSHQSGYLLQSQLYVEGHDVPLVKGADGRYQAELEIGELLVGDNGMLPAAARRKLSLTFDDEQYRQVMAGGMLYTLPFTLRDPGVYQVRAAVRDVRTGAVGSASQVMVVPKIGKGKLSMSGVALGSSRERVLATPSEADASTSETGRQVALPPGVFRRGNRSGTRS